MMRGQRFCFYSVALLVMLVVGACSRPSGPAEEAKPAATADSPGTAAPAATPAPASAPAPVAENEPPAKTETHPAKMTADRKAQQNAAPAPLPPPTASTDTPAPAPLPAPLPVPPPEPQESAPIPVPPPTPVAPPEPTTKDVTVPAGTQVYVRMIDSIRSDSSQAGQTFRASLDKPIVIDNLTVAPRNADVYVKLAAVESAGKMSGTSELTVQLDRIFIGKKSYTITSNQYTQKGSSEGAKAARNVGVGAAVGGILGGILGGTKGAVIGAGAGGGGGAVVSKGEQVHIDSETQLVFKLDNPLDVTLTIPPPSVASAGSPGAPGGPAKLAPPPDRPVLRTPNSTNSGGDYTDLTGTWNVTTDATQASMRLVLRQNGGNLQGSISNPMNGGTIQVQGTIDGNFITFSTPQNSAYPMQYSGAISGDRMQGTVLLPVNNNGVYGGGYPGGVGFPGSGYPGGNRRGSRATTQAHWNAQRTD